MPPMQTIYKYPLSSHRETTVRLPSGAKVLKIDVQNGDLFLWALVDTDAFLETRTIEVYGTGHPIPDGNRVFINTFFVHGGEYVFHAFERLK